VPWRLSAVNSEATSTMFALSRTSSMLRDEIFKCSHLLLLRFIVLM
jgi:hypothetical protein